MLFAEHGASRHDVTSPARDVTLGPTTVVDAVGDDVTARDVILGDADFVVGLLVVARIRGALLESWGKNALLQ